MTQDNSTPSAMAYEKCGPQADGWWVYLVRCSDQTLYSGVTVDLTRRVRQHNGELVGGARYTRGRRPVELVWHKVSDLTQRGTKIRSANASSVSAGQAKAYRRSDRCRLG